MDKKHYSVTKNSYICSIVYIDYNKLNGFKFKPRNKVKYDGVLVKEMILVKPSFIEKMLKKKIKRKLESYLDFVINLIDDDDEDPTNLRNALNDLTRYKRMINNKYRIHLDEKYIELLINKIDLLEKELKSKLIYKVDYQKEETSKKSR